MQRFTTGLMLIGLMSGMLNAMAEPEMRCRVNGAYIKIYGRNAAEQKELCARQGGELTRYVPNASGGGGPDPRGQAMNSIFGRRSPTGR